MRASARRALLLAATLGAACVTRTRRLAPSGATAAVGTPDMVQEMARQAVLLDAKGDRAADTLYAPDALVVANARVRLGTPRFAGVGLGGRATVAAAAVTLEGRFAWVLLGVRRAALDHLADLVRRAGADEPQHEIEDEPYGGELQDPQG